MWDEIGKGTLGHLEICAAALTVAIVLGVSAGAWSGASRFARGPLLGAATIGRTLPSMAVLALLVPVAGVGLVPAIVALVLLALPPLVVNTDLAVRGVPAHALDAATGLGMTTSQRWFRVIVPYALPVVLTGVRIATTEVIASATLATFIGAGGLGDDIVRGMQTSDAALLFASAAVVAALAFAADSLIAGASRVLENR